MQARLGATAQEAVSADEISSNLRLQQARSSLTPALTNPNLNPKPKPKPKPNPN